MQVFLPFLEPIQTAMVLDKRRLWKQIIEANQILAVYSGSMAWSNHPVVKMYRNDLEWLKLYLECLDEYRKGSIQQATEASLKSLEIQPSFLIEDLATNHKKRLYTKDSEFYKIFESYGTTEINMYWSWEENSWIYYKKNGKRI